MVFIDFKGHPNLSLRILCHHQFVGFPLRKEILMRIISSTAQAQDQFILMMSQPPDPNKT
ncbi:MAG: NADH-quinone oxidoreductase subunit C [Bdellovibrionales bacterium]